MLLLISLRDSRKSLGYVAFDTSSSIFPEYEPYGAVLNATVLIQRSVCFVSGKYVALLIEFGTIG